MNDTLLKQVLIRHEGYRTQAYKDTEGLLTCGIGHLCLSRDNLSVGDQVSYAQVQQWYDMDASRSTLIAKQFVPDLSNLDEVRQVVIVSLAFNLGNRLGGFKKALAAINAKDWATAAKELQNSKWFEQVGHRGPELCNALRTGIIDFL